MLLVVADVRDGFARCSVVALYRSRSKICPRRIS